jgi:hypothetical protein
MKILIVAFLFLTFGSPGYITPSRLRSRTLTVDAALGDRK